MTSNIKRIVSCIILIVFCFVVFSSSCFIITHADHDCTGENCSICIELVECQKALHTFGAAVAGAFKLTLTLCIAAVLSKVIIKAHSAHTTLISLKVELLN
ncbi:MAG TPA: hypothetical protein P5191_06565 [Ruminococcus sp.]|nr:hypothetical protein [Ruminococcus sp.]